MAKDQPRLDSVAAAARHAGVSIQTIRRYITKGMLTGYRVGPKLVKIDLNEVDALVHKIPSARD